MTLACYVMYCLSFSFHMSGQANHQEASIGSPATAVWADSNLLLGIGRCEEAVPERLTRVAKLLKSNALALTLSGRCCEKSHPVRASSALNNYRPKHLKQRRTSESGPGSELRTLKLPGLAPNLQPQKACHVCALSQVVANAGERW